MKYTILSILVAVFGMMSLTSCGDVVINESPSLSSAEEYEETEEVEEIEIVQTTGPSITYEYEYEYEE